MNILVQKLEEHKLKIFGLVAVLPALWYYKQSGPVCTSRERLDGKVAIITGCNSGIGKETSLDLAKRGAYVVMACRNVEESQFVCNEIKRKSNNKNVCVEPLDLESFESVKSFATRILENHEQIHILINNAGIMGCPQSQTEDGFEKHFQVNYLSHYLLTRLLVNRIKNTPQSRIINVTSKLYEMGKINWDNINMDSNYDPVECYKQSKLCNILFSNNLSRLLNPSDKVIVSVFSVSPGLVLTNLSRHFIRQFSPIKKTVYYLFYPFIWFILRSPKMGAQTSIYCAVEASLSSKTGLFYRNCEEQQLLPHAANREDEVRLWKLSEELVSNWL